MDVGIESNDDLDATVDKEALLACSVNLAFSPRDFTWSTSLIVRIEHSLAEDRPLESGASLEPCFKGVETCLGAVCAPGFERDRHDKP
jgi:hypothetical protein